MTELEYQQQMRFLLEEGRPKEVLLCYQELVRQSPSEEHIERLETLALVEQALRLLELPPTSPKISRKRRFNIAPAIRLVGICTALSIVFYCTLPLFKKQTRPLTSFQLLSSERDFALQEGYKLYQSAHYKEALEWGKKAYQLCMQLNDKAGAASSLVHEGQATVAMGDLPKALLLYEQSLSLRRETGPTISVAHVLYVLGSLQIELGEYQAGRLSLMESMNLRAAEQDKMGVIECQRSLGRLETYEHRYALAREWLHKASAGAKQEHKRDMEMALKAQLGMVSCFEGNTATARKMVQESLGYWQERKHPDWVAEMECNLSQIALAEGNIREAEQRAESSIRSYHQVGDQRGVANASVALANALVKQGHLERANNLFRSSLAYAVAKGYVPLKNQIQEAMNLQRTAP